eukprot:TRINITY_DN770_c0_g1_i5.p1 TRINITY_DN770_c0_g1~~TRINITY_DN770_c0_g1_i5.p1  ORF type:complete len:1086 (-),score=453.01 TRINITY_DN770_c0_g1_i5:85-3264(-)
MKFSWVLVALASATATATATATGTATDTAFFNKIFRRRGRVEAPQSVCEQAYEGACVSRGTRCHRNEAEVSGGCPGDSRCCTHEKKRAHVVSAPGSKCELAGATCIDERSGARCIGGARWRGMCPGHGGVLCCRRGTDVPVSEPAVVPAVVPAAGSECESRGGSCLNRRVRNECSGGGFTRFICPGDNKVQCCIPNQAAESEPESESESESGSEPAPPSEPESEPESGSESESGSETANGHVAAPTSTCVAEGGQCFDTRVNSACGGRYAKGLCPGVWQVRCCLPPVEDSGSNSDSQEQTQEQTQEDNSSNSDSQEQTQEPTPEDNSNNSDSQEQTQEPTPEDNSNNSDSQEQTQEPTPEDNNNGDSQVEEEDKEQEAQESDSRCKREGGSCFNTQLGRCSGELRSGLCPGKSHIRCCFAAGEDSEGGEQTAPVDVTVDDKSPRCTSAGGSCRDTRAAGSSCDGEYRSGLCHGASSIQCCIEVAEPVITPNPRPSIEEAREESAPPAEREDKRTEDVQPEPHHAPAPAEEAAEEAREREHAAETDAEEAETPARPSGHYPAPNSKCEKLGSHCQDRSVNGVCAGGDFAGGMCPGNQNIVCCVPNAGDATPVAGDEQQPVRFGSGSSEEEETAAAEEDSTTEEVGKDGPMRPYVAPTETGESDNFEDEDGASGPCRHPGTDGGPCLGGYRGVCARDTTSQLAFSASGDAALCDRGLKCVMADRESLSLAQALAAEEPYRHSGRTKARWDKGAPLPLDTRFARASPQATALAAKIIDVARRWRDEFNRNGRCKTLDRCGGDNTCNAVARQKEREFISKAQCTMLQSTLKDFGVINPWCAGFASSVLRTWKEENLSEIDPTFEVPAEPAVAFWRDWAFCNGHDVVSTRNLRPEDIRAGDFVIKATSHIGIATGETRVWSEAPDNWSIESIDGNTQDSGVPCRDTASMPAMHNMNEVDAGRNSGYMQYACRSRHDYGAIIRLRGITRDAKYRRRCWDRLRGLCNNARGFKCQDPRGLPPGAKPQNFCAYTPLWTRIAGAECPRGFSSRANKCPGSVSKCCVKN